MKSVWLTTTGAIRKLVTRSAMRPYGHVDFGGTLLEAMVEGDYLSPGAGVRVRAIQGGKIIVQPV